jgi:hypothetical protein
MQMMMKEMIMRKPSLTEPQRKAAALFEATISLVTLLPVARRTELEILRTHLDELLDYIIDQYHGMDSQEREYWDTIRDLTLAIYRVVAHRIGPT